jgi:myosin heavy subunit
LDVLGFAEGEKEGLFRCISAILLLGNLRFVADSEGQAAFACPEQVSTLCRVLGVGQADFSAALLNPVIRAGSEVVSQARDVAQVTQAVEALARALYDRLFTHIVARINQAIDRQFTNTTPSSGSTTFIGVLDIAGFEIFEQNSFEQLCVNYTNEKLQQFFNHHMFVSEQEEYRREGVAWDFIDFGLDLQPTIDLIEKANPIGILACLDEDCVVPKATDRSYCEKLGALWRGRSAKFEMTRFGDAFALQHYAGRVEYRTDGWLEKNKDPLNENVTRILAHSSHGIVAGLLSDYALADEDVYRRGGKRGQFRTLAQKYRESLTLLMQQLHTTKPHFVRCILPNVEKRAGLVDASLVLDQLRCNGVLEGIRICRLGYPNRIAFADFCRLYEILSPSPLGEDKKAAALSLLDALCRDCDSYRVGHGKIFFKAGELGQLDELRDQRLSAILQRFQARCRGALARHAKTKLIRQAEAKEVLQRNCRHFLALKRWDWFRLYSRVKPLLNVTRAENKIEELEGELERIQEEREQQLGNLRGELEAERDKLMALETSRREYERELGLLKIQLDEASESKAMLTERLAEMERESALVKERLSNDLSAKTKEFNLKTEAQQAFEAELRQQLEDQKGMVSSLKAQVEEAEFERLKLQRSESSLKARIQEMEGALDDLKQAKKDLELRLRAAEDLKRELEDRLADESLEEERRKEYQIGFDAQQRQLKARHQEELAALSDDFEAARKRLQREVLQLSADLEAERKQSAAHLAAVRKYESGADSLSSKLEAEMRAQEGWKRDKERLEARIKDLMRSHQESVEREDQQQLAISSAGEQLRALKAQLGQFEDEHIFGERQRKQVEAKLEKAQESLSHASGVISRLEASLSEAEAKVKELCASLAAEQDENVVLGERLRASEHLIKLHQHQKDDANRLLEEAQEEKRRLEQQLKDLQIRLLEHDDDPSIRSVSSSAVNASAISAICAQIEAECREREAVLRENRKLERSLQELSSRLSLQDHERISLEEALAKQEIRQRKTQTRLDEVEQALGEAELGKRRAERELAEEREETKRVLRELERLKAKQVSAQPQPMATGFVNIE